MSPLLPNRAPAFPTNDITQYHQNYYLEIKDPPLYFECAYGQHRRQMYIGGFCEGNSLSQVFGSYLEIIATKHIREHGIILRRKAKAVIDRSLQLELILRINPSFTDALLH